MADEVIISISDNGPYIVRGEVRLIDAAGNEFETKGTAALCRCGGSGNKPFCDGTHAKIGFRSEPRVSVPVSGAD